MMFKNRIKIFIIIFLVVLEFTSFFLMIKSFNNRVLTQTKEEHIVDKEKYGMFIENEEGKYVEYNESTLFPSNLKYTFNENKSSCVDTLNKEVDNAILYNENKITITSNKTVFCYLYFDLDKEVPKEFTFYIGGNSNPTYTTNINTTGYISWADTDIEKYCISTSSTSDNCTWKEIDNQTVTENITLASGDGTKTLYAYLKDYAGNETKVLDTIILDTTTPTIGSVTKTTDVETSIGISVSASDDNGISNYYYSINNGSYSKSTSGTHTFSGLTAGTTYSISVYVEDSAGNISKVTTKTYATKEVIYIGEYLLDNPTTGLNKTMQGGLYRYQGTSANNYVCFGTTIKSTCIGDTGTYMYRIIGINSSGQLKLIKKEALDNTYYWHNDYTFYKTWPNTDLYKGLNGKSGGTYSNLFVGNNSYSYMSTSNDWYKKISDTTWKHGGLGVGQSYILASNLYSFENSFTDTITSKIGLLYLHDYYYGLPGGNNCDSTENLYSTCKTSWIHLNNNDTGAPSNAEWTMLRTTGVSGNYYYAWVIASAGYPSSAYVHRSFSIRPVFYLNSDIQILSGTGTSSDPFIIS